MVGLTGLTPARRRFKQANQFSHLSVVRRDDPDVLRLEIAHSKQIVHDVQHLGSLVAGATFPSSSVSSTPSRSERTPWVGPNPATGSLQEVDAQQRNTRLQVDFHKNEALGNSRRIGCIRYCVVSMLDETPQAIRRSNNERLRPPRSARRLNTVGEVADDRRPKSVGGILSRWGPRRWVRWPG